MAMRRLRSACVFAAALSALLMGCVTMANASDSSTGDIPPCLQAAIAPEKMDAHTPPVAIYELELDGQRLYRLEKDLSRLRFVRMPDVAALDAHCKVVLSLPQREFDRRVRIVRILWVHPGKEYAGRIRAETPKPSE